jgi:hypothetical protein
MSQSTDFCWAREDNLPRSARSPVAPQSEHAMDQRDIAQQTLLEQRLLTNITQAIRTTIAWEPRGTDQAGKLRSLRFITASLERHLDHVMDLEEYDGYMSAALECSPNLAEKITALKEEHEHFRDRVHRLVAKLERIGSEDRTTLERVCVEIGDLLGRIDEHSRHEADLLQEAFLRDEGGEG